MPGGRRKTLKWRATDPEWVPCRGFSLWPWSPSMDKLKTEDFFKKLAQTGIKLKAKGSTFGYMAGLPLVGGAPDALPGRL